MSYDIDLINPDTEEVILLDNKHQVNGGTYKVGGTDEAHFNITYNYSEFFYKTLGEGGIRSLYGKTCVESIPILMEAAQKLGMDVSDNYWDSTEGNARVALLNLVKLAALVAEKTPEAIWRGD